MTQLVKPVNSTLNYLQLAARTLIASLFVFSIVYNLTRLDESINRMISHGFEHSRSVARTLIICAMSLSSFGAGAMLLNWYYAPHILLTFLLPVTIQEHLTPVINSLMNEQSIEYDAMISLLKNCALIGSLIVMTCLRAQMIPSQHISTKSWDRYTFAARVGRALIASLFLFSVIYNLTHLNESIDRMLTHGFEHGRELARILIICAMTLSSFGAVMLILNISYGAPLLVLFLLPVTIQEHLMPLLNSYFGSTNQSTGQSMTMYDSTISLLKNCALIGALILVTLLQTQLHHFEQDRLRDAVRFFSTQPDTKKSK